MNPGPRSQSLPPRRGRAVVMSNGCCLVVMSFDQVRLPRCPVPGHDRRPAPSMAMETPNGRSFVDILHQARSPRARASKPRSCTPRREKRSSPPPSRSPPLPSFSSRLSHGSRPKRRGWPDATIKARRPSAGIDGGETGIEIRASAPGLMSLTSFSPPCFVLLLVELRAVYAVIGRQRGYR